MYRIVTFSATAKDQYRQDISSENISIYNNIESAYNTFDVQFPIKIMCTSYNTSKFQVNVLLEINKFILDTY